MKKLIQMLGALTVLSALAMPAYSAENNRNPKVSRNQQYQCPCCQRSYGVGLVSDPEAGFFDDEFRVWMAKLVFYDLPLAYAGKGAEIAKENGKKAIEKTEKFLEDKVLTYKYPDYMFKKPEFPTIGDLKKVLGPKRLEGITQEQEKRFEDEWKNERTESKKVLYEIYANPEKAKAKMPKEILSDYEKFNPGLLAKDKLEEYKRILPWKLILDDKKLSESDRLMLYTLDKLDREIDKLAAENFVNHLFGKITNPRAEAEKNK